LSIKGAADKLYLAYQATGNYQKAFENYQLYISNRDSLESAESRQQVLRQESQYEYDKQALADKLAFQEQLATRNYMLLGGLGLALFAFLLFRYRQQKKLRENELKQEKEKVEHLHQVDQLKDQFLANTSHELRTPLQGIIGLSESLLDRTADMDDKEDLTMIVSSGKRLANLVNDILDFSKLKNFDISLDKKPVDLFSMVDVVIKNHLPLIKGKKLDLENAIPQNLPAAFADENRVQQILFNLIGNGVKFTETGIIKVSAEEKDGMLEVAVSDTGIGIPENKLDAIFNAFEQADGSAARSFAGTGLGLSISRNLVEEHGGQMWVESKVGEGSTFYFTLPLSQEAGQKQSFPSIETEIKPLKGDLTLGEKVAPIIHEDSLRILIVDDEPINHQVLRNFLRDTNYDVVSALNGSEALEILNHETDFDLVLLDVMMPRMSGYEVCEKIRNKYLPSELPIIMVTAKNQIYDLVQGLNTGANDYLAKPFGKDEFLARLNTHLNLHSINRATSRFVPTEFIKTLGKSGITEVSLGDHIAREVTVFFSDIRGYTTLAEQMKPEENFYFVNAYARRMGPIIQENHGFVNQFLGDGIMALFQRSSSDALNTAIEMQRELQRYNKKRVKKNR
ncbi:MAG: response regulator, partial [Bacteroidetes bacterium]|nr:response regulator [Bacteroidota bacterium]